MKRSKSIRIKILGCLLAISILPIVVLFIFTLRNITQFYHAQISTASNNEVKVVTSRINNIFENLDGVMTSLIFSEYDGRNCMLYICQNETQENLLTAGQRLENYRMYEYVCSNLIGNNQYAEGVYLFNESGYTYSFVRNRELGLEKEYKDSVWYQELMESESLQITKMYQPDNFPPDQQKIVIARRFTDVKGEHSAVLALVCNDSIFDNIQDNSLPWGKSFVMDTDGTILYGDSEDVSLKESEIQEIIGKESGVIIKNGSNDAYIYGTLNVEDWNIVNEVSFETLAQVSNKSTVYLIAIIAAILVFIIVLLLFTEKVLLTPLVSLASIMSNTRDIKQCFDNKYRTRQDEIGVLYRCYENMLKQINQLIEEKYVSEIQFLKSRLRNLMSQINAHFIFNTLENINCLAQIENNQQIVTMSKSLGDMLRYSIEYERDEEKLKTEVMHIRQYINIQEIRFGNQIQVDLDISEELLEAKVLKCMLQPVVENAIEHGLAGQEMPWEISIKAIRENGRLMIQVKDNGSGMDDETLIQVRERIYHPDSISEDARYSSIGLSNIHKRIQLLYCEKFGLAIDSRPGEGVTVTMTLPLNIS